MLLLKRRKKTKQKPLVKWRIKINAVKTENHKLFLPINL